MNKKLLILFIIAIIIDLKKKQKLSHGFVALLAYWFLHTFFKYHGWCHKKKVNGQHVFITGGSMGLGK